MQNAPPEEPVYRVPPEEDPDSGSPYVFGPWSPPFSRCLYGPQPSGRIKLVEPIPSFGDPESDRHLQKAQNRVRALTQGLILSRDWRALREQEMKFSFFTQQLMWQRGFPEFVTVQGTIDPEQEIAGFPVFVRDPADANNWDEQFGRREVVEEAESIYRRHGEVRLRIDLDRAGFDLCGPASRMRHGVDEICVTLRPVLDALLMEGLWVGGSSDRFQGLAREMVRLAQDERRRVGRAEFIRRWSGGER